MYRTESDMSIVAMDIVNTCTSLCLASSAVVNLLPTPGDLHLFVTQASLNCAF
jgi:hypothetical protein